MNSPGYTDGFNVNLRRLGSFIITATLAIVLSMSWIATHPKEAKAYTILLVISDDGTVQYCLKWTDPLGHMHITCTPG